MTIRQDEAMGIRIYRLLYAGVWLVFLAVPVIVAVRADVPVVLRVVALVATVCFVAVYLAAFWDEDDGPRPGRRAALRALVLAVLAAATLPATGYTGITYASFITAIVVFTLPVRAGLISGVTVWATAALVSLPFAEHPGPILGTGLGVLFIVVIRLAENFEHRQHHAEQELRQAAERDAIARDVHDVLGHSLTVLSIRAQLARRLIDLEPERAREEVDRIDALARESLAQVRSTVARLRTPHLASEVETAREALAAAGISADVEVRSVDDTDAELFAWALREAVTNVVRHAQASTCRVRVEPGRLRVEDDGVGGVGGVGGELVSDGAGSGLRGLRERASKAGARLAVSERDAGAERPGTVLEVSRP
ncbi:hypothetical protein BJF85_03950 [Saccharomonospora sp. CUA-673]|uniref:sensor histidine kinase n=1 Tax=Saccharomonospora sp. CUA-673 TaxID=1904969 RepID=UPI000962CD1A|nr:histidine kinase [Saccharomonospora sp. CUA-673]OLT43197.1 hypothetical protein BJF85_03950 [Saccharomonospora sp. CUA-673]